MYRPASGSARQAPPHPPPAAVAVAARAIPPYLRGMLRFLARFLGFWLVAAALVTAVVDGAKSIAASALVTTPLSEAWAMLLAMAGGGEAPGEPAAAAANGPLEIALAWLLAAPTVLLLAAPGVALLVIGAKRKRFSIGREFAT